jgi:Tir chaperone protein (CesT) family
MMGSSSRIDAAITAFVANLGVKTRAASDGSYSFRLSRSGVLSLTPSEVGDRLLISLSWSERGPESETLWSLLNRAGFDATTNRFMHSARADDGRMVLGLEFSEAELDAPTIDLAARRLIEAQTL